MVTMLLLILLPVAFLPPPGAEAAEIYGGWEARPHSRPYMAYLKIQRGDKIVRCGGSLVAENFVLTAAHCQGDAITVFLGAHNIDKRIDLRRQKIKVSEMFPHEKYSNRTKINDIMLLKLARAAKLNERVNTIRVAGTFENLPTGTNCSIAGWGCTVPGDNSSVVSRLREVDVEVLDDNKCTFAIYVPMLMLCAGRPQEGKDAAQGDSGGPLVCKDKVQGIVSKGSTSGTLPGVYTRVSIYSDWIKDTMRRA